MVITLCGNDSWRRHRELGAILDGHRSKYPAAAFRVFDFEDAGAMEDFDEFVRTPILFAVYKLAVVKNIAAVSLPRGFKKKIADVAVDDKVTVIISGSAIPADAKFLTEFAKPNLLRTFDDLSSAELFRFIKEEAGVRNIKLDDDAVTYLTQVFGGDTWGLVNELDRLSFLNSKDIGRDKLREAGLRRRNDFFELISGWFRKNMGDRLLNLEVLLKGGDDPAKIFNVMAYQDPSIVKKFADYDVLVKSGKLGYEEALTELALG